MQIFVFNHLKNNGKSLQKSTPQFGQHFAGGPHPESVSETEFCKKTKAAIVSGR